MELFRIIMILACLAPGALFSQKMFRLEKENTPQEDSAAATPDTTGATVQPAGDTVSWQSRTFEYNAALETFSLYQTALLKYKGAVLQADTIYLDNQAEKVEAFGKPVIRDRSQPEIRGYRLKYNHARQIGEIYYGSTRRDNQMFNGIEIRRQKSGIIYIARGDFSTCDHLEDQHFYFYCRRMVLEPNKKVLARPVVMNIADVPVAVAPMLVVPLGKGRRSGFTRPKMGGDQAQGFYMRNLGYYWAINDYTDFQLSGDLIEGQQGTFSETNLLGNYQYNRRNVLSGNLGGKAYISEFNPGNSGWEVNFAHNQNLTPDGVQKLTGSGRFVSSRRILGEALNEEEAVNQTANARLGYTNMLDWNKARLNVSGSQDFNLTNGQQNREFPRASLAFGGPLFPQHEDFYWETETEEKTEESMLSKINYSYSGDMSVYSENALIPDSNIYSTEFETYSGLKNHLNVSAKYALLQYINVVPGINADHYWNLHSKMRPDGEPEVDWQPEEFRAGDNFLTCNTGVNTNTTLYGIAQPELGRWEKIRHMVTPGVGFTWYPEIDSNRTFVPHPRLGGTNYQPERRVVSFNLGNDVDIKILDRDTSSSIKTQPLTPASDEKKSTTYKILHAGSSVNYDFEARDRKWSLITSNFSSEIVKYIPLALSTTHSLYDNFGPAARRNDVVAPIWMSYAFSWRRSLSLRGDMSSGQLSLKDGGDAALSKAPWSANASYGFSFNANRVSAIAWQKSLTHTFSGGFKLQPTPLWDLSYSTAYDFNKGEFSRHAFDFSRRLHCWTMTFSWTPTGISEGWRFNIYVNDIPDIKLESASTKLKTR